MIQLHDVMDLAPKPCLVLLVVAKMVDIEYGDLLRSIAGFSIKAKEGENKVNGEITIGRQSKGPQVRSGIVENLEGDNLDRASNITEDCERV